MIRLRFDIIDVGDIFSIPVSSKMALYFMISPFLNDCAYSQNKQIDKLEKKTVLGDMLQQLIL